MREQLYLPIDKFSIRFRHYLFFDTRPPLADQLFVRHRLRVWFGREFTKKGFSYVAVLCRVRKKDAERFDPVMEDLKKSMLITGHREYGKEVSELLDSMEEMCG